MSSMPGDNGDGLAPIVPKLVAATPPIPVGGPSSPFRPVAARKATVESFSEMTYACKEGESYASISQANYHTGDYGAALQAYNRSHWQASPRIKHDGVIVPGETIFLPPVEVLERRYPTLMVRQGAASEGSVAGGNGGPPSSGTAPAGLPGRSN